MLDLRTGSVMQTYPDIQNFRPPLASLISPCGTWVAGGSDCGVALLWNTDTGDKRDRSVELQMKVREDFTIIEIESAY